MVVGVVFVAIAASGCRTVTAPLRAGAEAVARDIYRTTVWTTQLPVELAKPIVVRAALRSYVANLGLSVDAQQRIEARIRSPEFVDAVVPFLFYMKEIYSAEYVGGRFQDHIERQYSAARGVPGIEHSLFRFGGAEADTPQNSAGVRPELIVGLVRLYDSLFLQTDTHPFQSGIDRDPAVIERTVPIVRELLVTYAAQTDEGSGVVDSVLGDEEKLEALTIFVSDLLRSFTHESYMRFARMAVRRSELEGWLLRELEKKDGGRLLDYLRMVSRERRYGVLTVVDGLQGSLVESLARGAAAHPFVEQVLRDYDASEKWRPQLERYDEAPAESLDFLRFFASEGYTDDRYLPFFRRLYQRESGGLARVGASSTPSLSVRNIPIVQTGAAVSGPYSTGIVNFQFLDRGKDRAYYFYGSDILQLDPLTRESGMKTLFSRLAYLNSLSANAYYDDDAHFSLDALVNLVLGERRRDFGDTLLLAELEKRLAVEKKLQGLRERLAEVVSDASETGSWRLAAQASYGHRARQLIEEIADLEDRGLPQLLVYYNPWPDHFAHFEGPFSDEIIAPSGEINRLDYWLSQVERVYRRAGVHARTLFGMAGDHGVAPARYLVDVTAQVLDAMAADGIPLKVRVNSSDEGDGPRLTHAIRPPSMRGYDVVASASAGANYTVDCFKDHGAGWGEQPLYRDLIALKTLANDTVDMVEEVRRRLPRVLDYMAVRDTPCGPGGGRVRLVATRDDQRVDAVVERRGRALYYDFGGDAGVDLLEVGTLSPYVETPEGEELLCYQDRLERAMSADSRDVTTWLNEDEWKELTSYTPRPDSVVQIGHLCDSDIVSTINLFPAPFMAFNSVVPGRHGGELFHEKDAFVGLWGAPVTRLSRPRLARNGEIAPAIYQYITGGEIVVGEDGWSHAPLDVEDAPVHASVVVDPR